MNVDYNEAGFFDKAFQYFIVYVKIQRQTVMEEESTTVIQWHYIMRTVMNDIW